MKNRVLFPAHQTLFSEDGVVGPRMRAYYVERARGGAGAVLVEGGATHDTTIKFPNYLFTHDPRIVRSLDELADGLRPTGCLGIVQIVHSGSRMSSHDARRALWAPSNVKSAILPEFPHAMTRTDIADVMAGYERSARHVGQSAIDGIKVHACHEYLFGQFLSPLNNLRDDAHHARCHPRGPHGRARGLKSRALRPLAGSHAVARDALVPVAEHFFIALEGLQEGPLG